VYIKEQKYNLMQGLLKKNQNQLNMHIKMAAEYVGKKRDPNKTYRKHNESAHV
jgi:hypothetical protein